MLIELKRRAADDDGESSEGTTKHTREIVIDN